MYQILIAIDQLFNTLCFWMPGGRWADETLSSRSWRIRHTHPIYHKVIDKIFFFDKNHCEYSYISEQLRLQAPPETRELQ